MRHFIVYYFRIILRLERVVTCFQSQPQSVQPTRASSPNVASNSAYPTGLPTPFSTSPKSHISLSQPDKVRRRERSATVQLPFLPRLFLIDKQSEFCVAAVEAPPSYRDFSRTNTFSDFPRDDTFSSQKKFVLILFYLFT